MSGCFLKKSAPQFSSVLCGVGFRVLGLGKLSGVGSSRTGAEGFVGVGFVSQGEGLGETF